MFPVIKHFFCVQCCDGSLEYCSEPGPLLEKRDLTNEADTEKSPMRGVSIGWKRHATQMDAEGGMQGRLPWEEEASK